MLLVFDLFSGVLDRRIRVNRDAVLSAHTGLHTLLVLGQSSSITHQLNADFRFHRLSSRGLGRSFRLLRAGWVCQDAQGSFLTAYFGFLTAQESKGTSPIFAFHRRAPLGKMLTF